MVAPPCKILGIDDEDDNDTGSDTDADINYIER